MIPQMTATFLWYKEAYRETTIMLLPHAVCGKDGPALSVDW